jgi:hypothetical protein
MVYSGYPNSQQPNFPLFPTYNLNGLLTSPSTCSINGLLTSPSTYNLNGLLTFNLQNSLSRAIAKTHNHPTTEQD